MDVFGPVSRCGRQVPSKFRLDSPSIPTDSPRFPARLLDPAFFRARADGEADDGASTEEEALAFNAAFSDLLTAADADVPFLSIGRFGEAAPPGHLSAISRPSVGHLSAINSAISRL